MTLYMPKIERKKAVPNKFSPDSRRIFGTIEEDHCLNTHYTTTHGSVEESAFGRTAVCSKPKATGFLMQNCRTLHEPVCNVQAGERQTEDHWWPTKLQTTPAPLKPKHTPFTTSRSDYVRFEELPPIATRHTSNPNSQASRGIVPVTHLPSGRGPRLLVEHISYQHQYNSRKSASLPPRGKLHGCFVWDVLHPEPRQHPTE